MCLVQKRAIRRIANYLASTSTHVDLPDDNLRLTTHGLVYRFDTEKGIECYVDAKFSGGWSQEDADNTENFLSFTGYVITCAGCPALWCSKLQT